jgi:spermidine/putrescine ABC transporter, periplasmic binding protein
MNRRLKNIGRIFLFIVLTLYTLSIFTACHNKQQAVLYLYNWTYYTPDSVIRAFEKKYNVKVVYDDFSSNEDMFAKLMAGSKGYDLVIPSADYVSIMIKLNMLEAIDISKIPNICYLRPEVLNRIDYDPNMKFSVPYYMGAAGIAVNTKEVPDYERSWNIFERADLKNRMTMIDDMREVLGAALGFLGYEPNSTNPDELEQAYRLIQNNWKPNLVKFDADGFAKSFASGDFLVVQGYAESIFSELQDEQAQHVDFFIPQGVHSGLYIDSFCIPKGAPHPEFAHAFINFMLDPAIYAKFLDTFGFPSSIHTEAGNYQKNQPHYTLDDLNDCILKQDLGVNLELYNSYWQRIRFTP